MGKLKIWTSQEDQLLVSISAQQLSKKWKKAAEELKKHGFDRSDIQCRERFVNHLDPNVTKGSWTDLELRTLYEKYSEFGNKWFLLQKHLPGRTQTKIKNYFYGSIRYLLKIIVKTVTSNKTGFINDIRTDTLLDIYEGRNGFHGTRLVEEVIRELGYRVDRKPAEEFVNNHFQMFQNFAKEYLLRHCKSRRGQEPEEAEEISLQSAEEEENAVRTVIEERELASQPIKIICSVNGIANDHLSELEYLQRMAKMHYDWHLFYQKAYDAVLEKGQLQKQDRITRSSSA